MPNGVISYFGSPHNDRRCKKALSTEGYFDNYLYILWKSLRPSLEIGSDIAFDNAGGIQPSTSIFHEATHNLIKFINIKRNSWIEATPALSNKEMYGYSNIITDKLFKQRHEIPQHPGVLGQYPVIGDSNWYSGQTSVIMFQGDYNSIEDSAARIEKLRSYGMIPCLHFVLAEKLINEGLI